MDSETFRQKEESKQTISAELVESFILEDDNIATFRVVVGRGLVKDKFIMTRHKASKDFGSRKTTLSEVVDIMVFYADTIEEDQFCLSVIEKHFGWKPALVDDSSVAVSYVERRTVYM